MAVVILDRDFAVALSQILGNLGENLQEPDDIDNMSQEEVDNLGALIFLDDDEWVELSTVDDVLELGLSEPGEIIGEGFVK